MEFEFVDSKKTKYLVKIDEEHLSIVEIEVINESTGSTYKTSVAFFEDVYCWKVGSKVLPSLVSQEAMDYIENRVSSFMKLKVFW
jgi:hypothetical protein